MGFKLLQIDIFISVCFAGKKKKKVKKNPDVEKT